MVQQRLAASLTPPPAELDGDSFGSEFADWPSYWDKLRAERPDLPGLAEHLDEAGDGAGSRRAEEPQSLSALFADWQARSKQLSDMLSGQLAH